MAASWTDSFAVLLVISAPEHKVLYGHEYFLIKLTLKNVVGRGGLRKWSSRGLLKRRAETPTQHFSSTKHSRGSGRGQRVGYLESPPKVSLQVLPVLTGTVPTRHAGRPVSLLLNAWREAALGKCMADCDDGEGRQACLQKITGH